MFDRGPNQDRMPAGGQPEQEDATYRDASYLGTSVDDEEEVMDLGFIVEDRRDPRTTLTESWQRLDDPESNEPLETDYQVSTAGGEAQEEDFVRTSMLSSDPGMNEGSDDFTNETFRELDGEPGAAGIVGHSRGIAPGFGSSLPQDLGLEGFEIRDNPVMQPQGQPVSGDRVSDQALGLRDVDEMGEEADLDALADRAAREVEP